MGSEMETIKTQLLREIANVSSDFGIYPQAVKGYNDERDYEQRDGFKNGWNKCVMEYRGKVDEVVDAYDSPWSKPVQLFAAADGWFENMGGKWCVFLSDTWYYACADAEEIPPEEYERVADLFCRYGFDGAMYWAFLKRGHLPEIKANAAAVEAVKAREEARQAKIAARKATLPTDSTARKSTPLASGCFAYFPAALAGVARLSQAGNDKHNPGEPLHHARDKSPDHADALARHLFDLLDARARGDKTAIVLEADAIAWRALALSQELHEGYAGAPLAPGARIPKDCRELDQRRAGDENRTIATD